MARLVIVVAVVAVVVLEVVVAAIEDHPIPFEEALAIEAEADPASVADNCRWDYRKGSWCG